MADVGSLIQSAQSRGLRLFLESGKVKIRAPQSLDRDTQAFIGELREHKEEIKSILGQDDPILSPDQWYPHFRDFHHKVIAETPNFDYGWLRANWPELLERIKTLENKLDGLGNAHLSEVMGTMKEWRTLILEAQIEQKEHQRRIQNGD